MTFFDKLLDPNNNIVCRGTDKDGNHTIRQCMEVYKNGIYVNNNLKMVNATVDYISNDWCTAIKKKRGFFLFYTYSCIKM